MINNVIVLLASWQLHQHAPQCTMLGVNQATWGIEAVKISEMGPGKKCD